MTTKINRCLSLNYFDDGLLKTPHVLDTRAKITVDMYVCLLTAR